VSVALAVLLPLLAAVCCRSPAGPGRSGGLAAFAPLALLLPLASGEARSWRWALLGLDLAVDAWGAALRAAHRRRLELAGWFALDRVTAATRGLLARLVAELVGHGAGAAGADARDLLPGLRGGVAVRLPDDRARAHRAAWRAGPHLPAAGLRGRGGHRQRRAASWPATTATWSWRCSRRRTSPPAWRRLRWPLLLSASPSSSASSRCTSGCRWRTRSLRCPASAILSGVIVKAGLLGWLKLARRRAWRRSRARLRCSGWASSRPSPACCWGSRRASSRPCWPTRPSARWGWCWWASRLSLQPGDARWLWRRSACWRCITGSPRRRCSWPRLRSRGLGRRRLLLALPALSLAAAPFATGFLAKGWLKRAGRRGHRAGPPASISYTLVTLTSAATALLMWHLWLLARASATPRRRSIQLGRCRAGRHTCPGSGPRAPIC
jgi:hypothetical protein